MPPDFFRMSQSPLISYDNSTEIRSNMLMRFVGNIVEHHRHVQKFGLPMEFYSEGLVWDIRSRANTL